MWFIRKILALFGIRRILEVKDDDGKVKKWEIVNESRGRFRVEAWRQMGAHFGEWYRGWILKSHPAIRAISWKPQPVLGALLYLAVTATLCMLVWALIAPLYDTTSSVVDYPVEKPDYVMETDPHTGLLLAGDLFYPAQLPDGHYSVARARPAGATIVVQHLPGLDRDFAYYVGNRFVTNVPDDCQIGERFSVFHGRVT